ncbi:hypothetical protein F66182_10971, partial [Fusarium sp. NRRL 66182]
MVDTVASEAPVGSPQNRYGNAFYAKKTKLRTSGEAKTDYNGATSRTWEMVNESKVHPYSKKPASYKLVSREVPGLLPKEGSLTSGEPSQGLPEWIAEGTASTENTDIVLWHTFGVTHIPAPEDFPIMPVEPMTLLLRPRNFFTNNPCMDVPPSYSITPTQVAEKKGALDQHDEA